MPVTRRIYVSMPANRWLTPAQNDLKWGIVEKIERLGYVPEIFTNPRGGPGLAASKAWSPDKADQVARHCIGAVLIGLPRWGFTEMRGRQRVPVNLPTEFCHYEGAIARTLRLPTLVVVQEDLLRRVVFDDNFGDYIGVFPPGADSSWLRQDEFRVAFGYWKERLRERRDIFLGYCSGSKKTARKLKVFLKDLGATVLDWRKDFSPGRTILQEIEEAAERCSAGIFLFTEDDQVAGQGKGRVEKAVPRDNVVFEAGYFIQAKGKKHVLIIRQADTKMPADLGGDIYASLEDKRRIGPIKGTVRRFVAGL